MLILNRQTFKLLVIIFLVIGGAFLSYVPANAESENKVILTETILQDRLKSPLLTDGISTFDLSHFMIDLSNRNAEFRDNFYQQIQDKLNRFQQPLGLDFSDCLIEGDFAIQKLGLSTPLSQASLPPILSQIENDQLAKDYSFVTAPNQSVPVITVFRGSLQFNHSIFMGKVDFSDTFFLQYVDILGAKFLQEANFSNARFGRKIDFSETQFEQEVNFYANTFWETVKFQNTEFQGLTKFAGSRFKKSVNFNETNFNKLTNFTRSQWLETANFSQVTFRDRALFSQSRFAQTLFFVNTTFEKSVSFRTSRFNDLIDFQDVKLLEQADFSNATFSPRARLNVSGLAFDSENAKLLGEPGVLGKIIDLTKLEGNETVVQNLVRNFRQLEQISDANTVEYKAKKLKLRQLTKNLFQRPLLSVFSIHWLLNFLHWFFLSSIILLSNYGTNFSLVLGIGIVTIAYFGILFWLVDRLRKWTYKKIIPNQYDILCVSISGVSLEILGLITILNSSPQGLITIAFLSLIILPITLGLVIFLYWQGRYHDLMETSYFKLEGSMRDLRLLIIRLPVIPEYFIFRDRYTFLVWQRRWNWLNYYDFSCNNFLKIGFNDIRLRDEHLPGIISILVWYQWGLGLLYIALLLWTLSRTIPGLNLLIYLK